MLKKNKGAGSRSREATEEKKLRDAEEIRGIGEATEEKKLRDAEEIRGIGEATEEKKLRDAEEENRERDKPYSSGE
jgi:hypothetical protein